jgi:hypothetical protein
VAQIDLPTAISDAAGAERGSAKQELPSVLPVGGSLKLATREIIAVISGITRDALGGIFQFVMRGLPARLTGHS